VFHDQHLNGTCEGVFGFSHNDLIFESKRIIKILLKSLHISEKTGLISLWNYDSPKPDRIVRTLNVTFVRGGLSTQPSVTTRSPTYVL
jgi:hypothetical protein